MSGKLGGVVPYEQNREVGRAGGVGWPDIALGSPNFPTGSSYSPTSQEVRFPTYATAGHSVSMAMPTELLADVMSWY